MNLNQVCKWTVAKISIFTMVMFPVAQGQAAKNQAAIINKASVQQSLQTLGLNKSMTYGEFYKKNQHLFPTYVKEQLAPYFNLHAKAVMPQFDIGQAKSSTGEMVPVLRVSQNGQLHNIQIYGDVEKFAKFDNTTLSAVDVQNFNDMMMRLTNGDVKLRKQAFDVANTKNKTMFTTGYPDIGKDAWKKMSRTDRARYILNMRDLWLDSKKVLQEKSKIEAKNKKNKSYSFFNVLFSNSAVAQTQEIPPPANASFDGDDGSISNTTVSATSSPRRTGATCIVAGYVSTYTSKGVCSIDNIIRSQVENGIIEKANYGASDVNAGRKKSVATACENQKGFYACNPLIYGTPGGNPICINRRSVEFQKATHWQADVNNSCDQSARLTNNYIELGGNNKTAEFYQNALVNANSAAFIEQETQDFARSRDFLNGLLKFQGLGELYDKALDDSSLALIKTFRDNFNADITQARESCSSQMNYKGHEKNFYGACEQLHKRFLYVADVLSKTPGCKDGSQIDRDSLQCKCSDGKSVNPGAQCAKPASPDVTPVTPVNPDNSTCNPACDAKTEKCVLAAEHNGVKSYECKPIADVKPDKKKGKFGAFLNKALPWIAGAAALTAMYFLWKPKIPKLNPAGDKCPDGTTMPCAPVCTNVNQVRVNGTCVCAACPPGQTVINQAECLCGNTGIVNPTNITCADGVTIVTDISQCPKTLYTCWDGTKVENPINCPEQPQPATGGSSVGTGN